MKSMFGRFTLLSLLVMPLAALAGTPADPEFAGVVTRFTNWATGNAALSISLAALIGGSLYGLARMSVMPALVSLVFAILFSVGAGVIQGIIGAVI